MKARPFDLAFAARPGSRSRAGLALAVAGALAAICAGVHLLDARSQAAEMQARMAPPPGAARPAVRLDREGLRGFNDQVRATNLHIRNLNMAWDEVFRAIRVPEGVDVVLVGLDTTGRSGVLRLHGESRRFESMTDYVDLVAQRQAFSGAQLVKHEVARDNPNAPYRFTIEATWRR